ncbi:DUF6942 family protein [Shewanella youngdeokensis]|uniref:Uracil-DNA glycosylase-like domain-containing protein n=1 Tax=Shewanella youngdeokensis TaxID=2999068 RepID=A0ABZ0JUP2_9GAMM|nr:hypothetical protein RGE70_11150 [Shewanella sp. DAU334]
MTILGPEQTVTSIYLPTSPIKGDQWHYNNIDAVQSLIDLNGNHWRKILTIAAKLSVTGQNWRQYRDANLLKQHEAIITAAVSLQPNSTTHIICGHESALALGLQWNSANYKPLIAGDNKLLKHHQLPIYLCPYLDYRQFPNHHINIVRQALGKVLLD